jgi:hypothetical protein
MVEIIWLCGLKSNLFFRSPMHREWFFIGHARTEGLADSGEIGGASDSTDGVDVNLDGELIADAIGDHRFSYRPWPNHSEASLFHVRSLYEYLGESQSKSFRRSTHAAYSSALKRSSIVSTSDTVSGVLGTTIISKSP